MAGGGGSAGASPCISKPRTGGNGSSHSEPGEAYQLVRPVVFPGHGTGGPVPSNHDQRQWREWLQPFRAAGSLPALALRAGEPRATTGKRPRARNSGSVRASSSPSHLVGFSLLGRFQQLALTLHVPARVCDAAPGATTPRAAGTLPGRRSPGSARRWGASSPLRS